MKIKDNYTRKDVALILVELYEMYGSLGPTAIDIPKDIEKLGFDFEDVQHEYYMEDEEYRKDFEKDYEKWEKENDE